jgi:hypothetical protein
LRCHRRHAAVAVKHGVRRMEPPRHCCGGEERIARQRWWR